MLGFPTEGVTVTADVGTMRPERTPVEHRVLGLDKRSFPYAFFVLAVFLVATVVMPRIDDTISWDDPVQAGDQMALSGGLVFTPVAGWNVVKGDRVGAGGPVTGSKEVQLVHDGVTFDVAADSFDGKPRALLRQVAKVTNGTDDPTFKVSGKPTTITTADGNVGVIQSYSSVNGDGLVAAFVIDGTGLKITAYGQPSQLTPAADDLAAMIDSLRKSDGSSS